MKKEIKSSAKKEVVKPQGMTATVLVRFLRISPRKMRLVIDAVRRKPVGQAEMILNTLNKKAARMVAKALKSAVANAKVKGMDISRLYVSDVRANGGPVFKRFMSRSMGRADRLLKRTTHLSLAVAEGQRSFGPREAQVEASQEQKNSKAPAKAKRTVRAKKAAASKA